MSNEKRTGLGSVPAGLLRPTTRPDAKDKDRDKKEPETVVEETPEPVAEIAPEVEVKETVAAPAAKETKSAAPRASRKRRSAAESERVVPWKIYLPESIHFRLRQLAYERGLKLSEAAAEVLDRGLPFYEIVRKDRAG